MARQSILLVALWIYPVTALPGVRAAEFPLGLNRERSHQVTIQELPDGALEITTLGEDPWVECYPFDVNQVAPDQTVLAFEYFCPAGIQGLNVYYGPPITAAKRLEAGTLVRAESWLPYSINLQALSQGRWTAKSNLLRLDFGQRGGVTLRLRNVRLRPPNAAELRSEAERAVERQEKQQRAAHIDAFYRNDFPHRIDAVVVERERIVVNGHMAATDEPLRLIELAPEVSLADHAEQLVPRFVLDPQPGVRELTEQPAGGDFSISVPRRREGADRSGSRWALASLRSNGAWQLASHWKYATDLSAAATHSLPRVTVPGIKGLGGIGNGMPLEELIELGVHHITINMPITQVMDTVDHPGWIRHEAAGRTWYVNPRHIDGFDRLARFSSEHNIIATAIVLLPFGKSEFAQRLIHPEADQAGHYAMPNFTTAEGVAAYESVMDFLAQRYTAPGSPHGRITNWIIHNEVGYGWEWTNMGHQPAMLYMDHYLRSMRLVHNVTRRYDPHARVFISLTHHWNTPTDSDWKSYSNRELVQRLVESSQIEGDFAWGVAYHPYPQNLRRPDAWNDTRVTNDFETPLITPKNISVLDRWMHRPEMRDAAGKVRGVLLSEQGFNTPDYSEESQRLQAAGYVYMWRQLKGLASIEAFHNHRWIDHPHEGGLLLGLRTLPAAGEPFGRKKFSWHIYQALDTPQEAEATRFAGAILE